MQITNNVDIAPNPIGHGIIYLGYAEQGKSYYSTWCVVARCCLEYYVCLLQSSKVGLY